MRARAAVFLLCAVVLMPFGLTGTKADARTVTFAVGGAPVEVAFWEEVIRDFTAATGIAVDLLRQPADTGIRRQSLVVALQARQSDPDVFLMDVAWLAQFAASGWLVPLDRYLNKGECGSREDFFEQILDLADTYKGRLVALPVYNDAGLLYYRTDLLEKYGISGPPETWDELLRYARKVQADMRRTNPAFYGFVWQGAQYEGLITTFLEFAGADGGFVSRDGRIVVDTPENRRAVAFMRDLIHEHGISPPDTYTSMKEEEVRAYFQEGKALFARNWPYAFALHQGEDSAVRGKIGIAPVPAEGPGKSVSTLGGWHVGLSAFSDAAPQARALLCHITSYAVQKRLALRLAWNPGRKDVYADPDVLAELPHFKTLRHVFENARPRPFLPYYTQLSEILQRSLSAVLAGRSSPEAALAEAQGEIDALLRRYSLP
jgi:multiple sugar transport system substrate-binding protein